MPKPTEETLLDLSTQELHYEEPTDGTYVYSYTFPQAGKWFCWNVVLGYSYTENHGEGDSTTFSGSLNSEAGLKTIGIFDTKLVEYRRGNPPIKGVYLRGFAWRIE